MAHDLYTTASGSAAMAFIGKTPWHKLGVSMPANAPLEQWIEQAGFDWRIEQAPVTYVVQNDAGEKRLATMDERFVLYRSDTRKALSVMSGRYQIVQPGTVMEFFRDITRDNGLTMETAGVLKDGSVYWALAKTGQEASINGDRHNGYVLLATSADGSLATIAKMTSVRVVCNNTLSFAAQNKGGKEVRVKHNTTFDPARAKKSLDLVDFEVSWENFTETLRRLADIPVTEKQATGYFEELLRPANHRAAPRGNFNASSFNQLLNAPAGYGYHDTPTDKAPVERAIRGLSTLQECYRKAPGAVPGTAYGLVQGVTRYIDHERGKDANKRLASAWFGQGETIKQRAVSAALDLAA